MKTAILKLQPTDSRKSFYGKAKVILKDDTKYLLSYDTIIASVNEKGTVKRLSDYRSVTTSRHIKAFLETFTNMSFKDFMKLGVVSHKPVNVLL